MPFAVPFTLPGGASAGPGIPFSNLGFEIAGSNGRPAFWTVTIVSSAERIAIYGSVTPRLEEESFEAEWSSNEDYLFDFDGVTLTAPIWDEDVSEGEGVEDFEEGWLSNEGYLFEMGSEDPADFDGVSDNDENFESGWSSNESYMFTLPATTAAVFDAALTPEAIEDFEDGWRGGAGNDLETTLGSTDDAIFYGVSGDPFEDFETVYTEIQVSADPSTDTLTVVGHGQNVGNKVTLRLSGAGALPAGLSGTYEYFIVALGFGANTIRLSTVSAGSVIDLADAGAGVFYLRPDPRYYWIVDGP